MQSARASVAPAVDRILSYAADAHLSDSQTSDLAIAVSEALANAAIHGNRLDPDRPVAVVVKIAGSQVTIDIQDDGPGFDHSVVRDPTADAHVLMPGGRGVFLMRHLVDSMEYNETGNRVRLTVRAR
jgi:serine/threonine-protein kinase RsbW